MKTSGDTPRESAPPGLPGMMNQANNSSRLFTQGREKISGKKGDDRGMKSLGRNISMSDETKGRSRKLQELL